MALRVAELETLFTADVDSFEKKAQGVETRQKQLDGARAEVVVEADTSGALASLDRVEGEAKSLTKGEIFVEAVTSGAMDELEKLEDQAGDAGGDAGDAAGSGLAGGIVAAIATIPVAGAIVGIGAAIGKALTDGLQVEVRSDRLMATTGLDPVTVGKLARASGEAYASNWGESLASNMDTARLAIQRGLLDPEATARDSQKVIESLSGVSDIIGEEIPRVAAATAALMKTGLAKDSQAAFDIIVKGFQRGNDVGEDWLDTLTEYPALFERLGLTGEEATGLINQGLEAGARNSDFVADALKEFQIRATDSSKASADAYKLIGLSAEDMTAKIAKGGEDAKEGLDIVLDRLRETEDPVLRNAAAVGLFGTKAEDLGDSLWALDLTTAVDELGRVEGAAAAALGVLSDNAAGDIETAKRNIQVAADGISGALAAAFNPQIEDFATFVAENREQVMQFLLDLANGGLDAGRTFVEGMATATEGVGSFISGPLADLVEALGEVVIGIDAATPGDQGGKAFQEWAQESAAGLRGVKDTTDELADTMRTNLIENGINPAQEKLNEVAIPLIAQAALHDATVALASDIDNLGYAADGSKQELDLLNGKFDTSSESGRLLHEQLRGVVEGLDEQTLAGIASKESQEDLQAQYDASREALLNQLEAMGMTREEAEALIETYGAVPDRVDTLVEADTAIAEERMNRMIEAYTNRTITMQADIKLRTNELGSIINGYGGRDWSIGGLRAGGGPVSAGQGYVVGEREPEWFEPSVNGTIFNSSQLASLGFKIEGGELTRTSSPTPGAGGGGGLGFSGPLIGQLTAVGYDPDDAVRRFGEELSDAMWFWQNGSAYTKGSS